MWALNCQFQWPVQSFLLLDLLAESDLSDVLIFGLYWLVFLSSYSYFFSLFFSYKCLLGWYFPKFCFIFLFFYMSWLVTAIFFLITSVIINNYFSAYDLYLEPQIHIFIPYFKRRCFSSQFYIILEYLTGCQPWLAFSLYFLP